MIMGSLGRSVQGFLVHGNFLSSFAPSTEENKLYLVLPHL